jgi:nucleotide-binding universal stress UspA family protein
VLEGDPAGTLVETAAHDDVDLLVVGTHAHTGMRAVILGSVARNVLVHTKASVLVVHQTSLEDPLPDRDHAAVGAA